MYVQLMQIKVTMMNSIFSSNIPIWSEIIAWNKLFWKLCHQKLFSWIIVDPELTTKQFIGEVKMTYSVAVNSEENKFTKYYESFE